MPGCNAVGSLFRLAWMADAARPVFISYARLDQPLVSRAVEFLRGGGLNVFVDSQSIGYGTDWRQALVDAIENAERVMLFWTAAAAVSKWVTQEWQLPLKRGKKVVPTLLDDTPLPPALARLHAVTTLRGLFPAPIRRPEDLMAEPPLPDDEESATSAPPESPSTWADIRYSARESATVAAPGPVFHPPASSGSSRQPRSPVRFAVIAASLAAAGLLTWVLVNFTEMSAVPAPAPPASVASAAGLGPASSPALPASGVTPVEPASAPHAVPAPPPEPAMMGDLLDSSLLVLPAGAVLLFGSGIWMLRRLVQYRRARAVVREVYAL